MFYRIYPQKDCFITNYLGADNANTGASEILQLFKVAEGAASGSRSHILTKFDLAGQQIFSGSDYVLRMFDARHDTTLPTSYDVVVRPLEQSWDEGRGHDVDAYKDSGVANWLSASHVDTWVSPGAYPSSSLSSTFHFDAGHEDLEVDVGNMISSASNGFLIQIAPEQESDSNDYYIKMFHSRQTHYPTKAPHLEIRWADWTGSASGSTPRGEIVSTIYDLKDVYRASEMVTLHMQVQPRDWNPSVVSTASSDVSWPVLTKAYYQIADDLTDDIVVPFGTGSVEYTRLSYNDQGNYFKLHMGSLPAGTVYRIEFIYQPENTDEWIFIPGDKFKFRIK